MPAVGPPGKVRTGQVTVGTVRARVTLTEPKQSVAPVVWARDGTPSSTLASVIPYRYSTCYLPVLTTCRFSHEFVYMYTGGRRQWASL